MRDRLKEPITLNPTPTARLTTSRLELVPLTPGDADEMATVLGDEQLYSFIGGVPPTVEQLRERYRRLVVGGSADGRQEWRNWIVRLSFSGEAIGTVQATIIDAGRRAEVAWVISLARQGRGFASEAAAALVRWLEARGVQAITAHIHPGHGASATVATRAGLVPTDEIDADGERIWQRIVGAS